MPEAMPVLHDIDIDDCWNTIGVRGDGSCSELSKHLRCLNCPTYASAALRMLDRVDAYAQEDGGWGASSEAEAQANEFDVQHHHELNNSALVFRIGAEWLALSTLVVVEVAELRPVHSLPHQRNAAILGLFNVRGALQICISLRRVLTEQTEDDSLLARRLLVVAHEGQTLVFPVDEVAGVQRFAERRLEPVPTTVAHASATYTRGMLNSPQGKVGLLDHGLLFYGLNRSFT
jgi:chemotaxis-related protein WspD